MMTDEEGRKIDTVESVSDALTAWHLVTPQSQLEPLCGFRHPRARIGMCAEHWTDDGKSIREVYDADGRRVRGCRGCLSRYPSYGNHPGIVQQLTDMQILLTIKPYPVFVRDEFVITPYCSNKNYKVCPDPTVVGQRAMHGLVALSMCVHLVPLPATERDNG
jgi:hypothetical protein